jgi:hypothetical protein
MSLTTTQKEQCRLQLAEKEAKWVNATLNDAIGRQSITRKWKVGHDRIDSALEYLNTYGFTTGTGEGTLNTIVDPKMGDETFTGTFRQVRCFDGATSGDAGWVYQELRRVQAPATEVALSVLQHLRTQEEEVVRPFGFTSGKTWDEAFVFYDINPNSKATFEAFTAANLVARLPGSGWTYVDRKWQDAEDNTATFVVLFKKVEWKNLWMADDAVGAVGARIVGESNPNDTDGEATRTNEAEGVSKDNLSTVYTDAKKNTNVTGGTHNRVVESVSLSEREPGENVVRNVEGQARRMGIVGTNKDHALTINLTPEIGIKNATATRRWKRVETAYKNALVAAGGLAREDFKCPETLDVVYTHTEVSITDHGNGVYTVTQSGFAFEQTLIDTYKDVRGKAVYYTVRDESVVTTMKLYVRWPVYRHYHIFRATWIDCWNACDAKDGGGDPPPYPITGDISIGTFGSWLYHGQVTTFRGWTAWQDADSTPVT